MATVRTFRTSAFCFVPVALSLFLSTSCGYALSGRGSFLPDYIKNIGIPQFVNQTVVFDLDRVVTQQVQREFASHGHYKVTQETTGVDARVLPRSVVYDASLMLGLSVPTSVASGFNALAHCVDAMWAPRTDPIDQVLALEGIRALRHGLPRVVADPWELDGREQTLYGAYVAAVAFASAGSGLHHKICHVLGGMFGLPHAETHAVVLPHVLALNAPAVPELDHRMAEALGAGSALTGVLVLRDETDAPRSLRDLGLDADDLPSAVPAILDAAPPGNPTAVTAGNIEALLRAAWEGKEPA